MYKFIVIFFFLCFFSHSQVLNNNLVVLSETGEKFTLYVNGAQINKEPQADVKAFDISEGWCRLVAKFEKDETIVSDSIHIKGFEKNNHKEITYSIKQNANKSGKFSFVSIGEPSGPPTPKVPEPPVIKGPVVDNNRYGNLYQAKDNKPVFFKNYDDSTGKCKINLSDDDVLHGINLVTKRNDLHDKYNYIETIIDNNCYTVNQLSPFLSLLETEMDKLKIAKKAYPHLIDKNNKNKISEIFLFKSVKDDYEYFLEETANTEHQLSLKCAVAVSDNKVSEIINTIKKENYEHDKLRVAKEQMINNCVNAAQVKKILNIFNHDRERMDFVRSAYNVTVDKENYKILEENFQFGDNKTEFLKFISK